MREAVFHTSVCPCLEQSLNRTPARAALCPLPNKIDSSLCGGSAQIEVNPFLYRPATLAFFASKGVAIQSYRALRQVGRARERTQRSDATVRWRCEVP